MKKRFRWENTSDGPLLRNFWVASERKRLCYSGDVAEAMSVQNHTAIRACSESLM